MTAAVSDPSQLDLATWLAGASAVISVIALGVALFQERARQVFARARLGFDLKLEPPDAHRIALTDAATGTFVGWSLWLRLRVSHRKGPAAENAEAMVTRLWRNTGGTWVEVSSFLPLSLTWSHFTPPTSNARIPHHLSRHCDLGYFQRDPRTGRASAALFRFSTLPQPNPLAPNSLPPNFLEPGNYRFEIILTADNCRAQRKTWQLVFDKWHDDEIRMLTAIRLANA